MTRTEYLTELTKVAVRQLKKLPKADRHRVWRAVAGLATNPRPHGSVKLKNPAEPGDYRLRVGVYRVTYRVDDAARVVEVVQVSHRKQAYR